MERSREQYEKRIRAYRRHIEIVEKALFVIASKFLEEYSPDRDANIIKMLELLLRENRDHFFNGDF
jgi:hypothetical protein